MPAGRINDNLGSRCPASPVPLGVRDQLETFTRNTHRQFPPVIGHHFWKQSSFWKLVGVLQRWRFPLGGETRKRMGFHKEIVLILLVGSIAVVASQWALQPPPLPIITRVMVETSEWNAGASITVDYQAPDKPFALWFVDGLPIPQERRVDYTVYNNYRVAGGATSLTSSHNKWSNFGVCLLNTVAENCVYLRPLPSDGLVSEDVDFPWPLMTPGPLVRYYEGNMLRIHAPVMNVSHTYTYSAMLLSENPDYAHGKLVYASSRDMTGGRIGDQVTVGPVTRGTGWIISVRTDQANYEGVLLINTTYVPVSGLVQSSSLNRPFSIYRHLHSAPFREGFVAAAPLPLPWRCRENMACMIACPFLSNGPVNVTISRRPINSVLNAEQFPMQPEEMEATTRMLGPYLGYGYIFIPNYLGLRDYGTYKCEYTSNITRAFSEIEVL